MTQKQLKEQVRIECHKYYKKLYDEKLEKLEAENKNLQKDNYEVNKENIQLKRENNILREDLSILKDWNRRLQEFMDMSDEDRNKAFKEMKDRAESSANLKAISGMFNEILKISYFQ